MKLGQGAAFIWDPVDKIEVVDDYTVSFILKYPAPLDRIAASSYGAMDSRRCTVGTARVPVVAVGFPCLNLVNFRSIPPPEAAMDATASALCAQCTRMLWFPIRN